MNNLSPEDCTFFLITRASLAVTSVFKKALANHRLTDVKPSYLGVLMCLWKDEAMDEVLGKLGTDDGMKLSELGRCAGVEPSTITGLIDRMEKDGLVYRSSMPNDRRANKANLAEKGSAIRSKVFDALDELAQEVFAGIEGDDIETIKKILRKMIENAYKKKGGA